MKRVYEKPSIEIKELNKEDVITTSGVAHTFGDLLPKPGDKTVEW